jgi:hypothetical protein
MEKWNLYEKCEIQIELIENFSGGNRECVIYFVDNQNRKGKLTFTNVFDFRYAIENAFIDRFSNIPKGIHGKNSVYILDQSDYKSYFENQVSGTIPVEKILHFVIFDKIDTGIEVLTDQDPILSQQP